MPLDPSIVGGLITGGSNIVDVGMQAITNAQNWKHTKEMYNRQRADALSDWNMQNAYNAPSAQMERLKAAKLNPNLVYGTGVQASGISSPVRSASGSAPAGTAPHANLGEAFQAVYDTKMKQTQIDTMKSVQDLNKAKESQVMNDAIMKAKNANYIDVKTAKEKIAVNLATSTFGYNVDAARLHNEQTQAQTDKLVQDVVFSQSENIRREFLSAATFQEKMQHIALMIAQEAAARQGIALSKDMQTKIQAETDILGTTQLGKDLQNQMSKKVLDNFSLDQIRRWVATFINPISGLMK